MVAVSIFLVLNSRHPGTGPSKVFVYDRNTGVLDTEIVVSGENLAFEHAPSCNAVRTLHAAEAAVYEHAFVHSY
jgi:hypothetical protein